MTFPDSPSALLQELIRIPSVNPDVARDQGATGEFACAQRVGELLLACGATVSFDEVQPGRPNVIGRFPGGERKPGLLFAPHSRHRQCAGYVDRSFRRGNSRRKNLRARASDTKGTMAAMLWALHELREEIASLSSAVTFVGLMGEEAGQPGSIHFASRYGDQFNFALVGEPTSLETVYAHKGLCLAATEHKWTRSCHGSTPERGIKTRFA